jgi:hypothetical protein
MKNSLTFSSRFLTLQWPRAAWYIFICDIDSSQVCRPATHFHNKMKTKTKRNEWHEIDDDKWNLPARRRPTQSRARSTSRSCPERCPPSPGALAHTLFYSGNFCLRKNFLNSLLFRGLFCLLACVCRFVSSHLAVLIEAFLLRALLIHPLACANVRVLYYIMYVIISCMLYVRNYIMHVRTSTDVFDSNIDDMLGTKRKRGRRKDLFRKLSSENWALKILRYLKAHPALCTTRPRSWRPAEPFGFTRKEKKRKTV